ncbi:MAG: hypothetical protein VYA30_12135 [Myxococcota bacterium]|nr:hypothetical protein [Myxococcota bacterium]
MIGVVICTHSNLAPALLDAATMIVGTFENSASVTVQTGDSGEKIVDELTEAIKVVERGSGTIVLCDMFGGTPSNVSLSLLSQDIEVVTGVNLPMLLKLFTCRDKPLSDVAKLIQSHGRDNILVAGAMMRASGNT